MSTMREQSPKGGVIQQVTSIGGQTGVPTFSIYCVSYMHTQMKTHDADMLSRRLSGLSRDSPRPLPKRSSRSGTSSLPVSILGG